MSLNSRQAITAFIQANTKILQPPLVPEISLHLAEESLPIWQKTEEELGEMNVPPPFWAFAWAGGQALARYLLDNRALVADKRVWDVGSGSGLSAIAAGLAGATDVVAYDIDRLSLVAMAMNAELNGVALQASSEDVLDQAGVDVDVLLVGDLFYERTVADRVLGLVDRVSRSNTLVLVGDPQRGYFPKDRFDSVAEYHVPVTRELEDSEIKRSAVWRIRPQER